VEKTEF